MSAKPFGKLREEFLARPGASQALERARQNLDAEVASYEAGLAQLRKAHGLTQEQLARQLGVSQGEVSRVERRSDLFLSTLHSYVEAMGGELELVAAFDDERVKLSIGELLSADDDEITEDQAEAPAAATKFIWDVEASLEFSGPVNDPAVEKFRAALLRVTCVTSDAVGIRRGKYSDILDVSFALEARDDTHARERANRALTRATIDTGMRRAKGFRVELAAPVG